MPATIDPPEAHHQRHGAGIVERPAIAPANTPQRPSLGRHIRHKPYPKRKQEVTAPRGVGPDRTRRGNHSSKLPNGSVALGSNVSSEVWGPSIGRKSSTIASAAEYLEDSSQSQSILSDYSDHTAFDPLPIPREHRGHTIRSSLPPPPTLSHRSSFEDINLGPSITTGGHGFMNPLQHPSLEFLNTPSKDPPPEMYSGDWTQHTPSHPLTPVTPVSSHGIPDYVYVVPTQIHEPVPMRQMMPQYFPSVHVASPGYHDMITNGPGSSYITDYYFPTQLHGAPRPNHSWNGQGPVNTIHPPQTYIAVEEDSEIARNVEEWLNTEYIMSQE